MAKIPEGYRRIEGSERRAAPGARLVGPADPREVLSVSIRVRRKPDAPRLPDQAYWAATPVRQRKFLSRQEFTAQYGAAQADLDRVADFARSRGLTVVETSIARRTVVVSGTVEQMSRVFAVELGRYESPTETYRGREGHVHLPKDVASVVEGVFGLDNRRMARRAACPPGASLLTPPQVAQLYNFPAPATATGETIGILEFGGGFAINDIQGFMAGLGLNFNPLTVRAVSVDGATNALAGSAQNVTQVDPDIEVALDIEVAASVAQGANIAVYFAPIDERGWVDAVTTAVFDPVNSPSVLSISWGWPELDPTGDLPPPGGPFFWPFAWTQQAIGAVSTTFQEAAAMGITVFVAAGDSGSDAQEGDGNAHVIYPASDPFVTACGGTFIANVAGNTFTEGTWNDPRLPGTPPTGATGGGISDIFDPPPWQAAANVPPSQNPGGRRGRGIPDVAGNASPCSGYNLVLYGQQTSALIVTSGPGAGKPLGPIGGTSAVAPLYAGLVALINAANSGGPVGYINPTLYALAESPGQNVLRDINDGANNQWSGELRTTPSYASGVGWDACTGWGSINGSALLGALLQVEETQMINPDDPFKFGIRPGETSWVNVKDVGNTSTGADVQLGMGNSADANDATVVTTPAPKNAALAGQNSDPGDGVVGVFGRSKGATRSIGVAGETEAGCGVYGIATVGTIGVAGRSMGGIAVEDAPLEKVVGQPIGVLGHSTNGPGVRGHGGPLLKLSPQSPPPPPVQAAEGGVFSSGQIQDVVMAGIQFPADFSRDPLAQLRLIPSARPILPNIAAIGDFFLVYVENPLAGGGAAQLWICTDIKGTTPQWQEVLMGPPKAGGLVI